MKIYNFSAENGVLIGESIADEDPMHKGNFLIPAMATTIEPPITKENELVSFDGKNWRVSQIKQTSLTESEKKELQYNAIDAHIYTTIKTANIIGEPANYDNLGELALYINSNNANYRMEAQTLIAFVEECHKIQDDIKNGMVTFDSIDAAIAALPTV